MIKDKKFNELFAPDQTLILVGGKGSGKTNLGCVLMEQAVALGYSIYTNIHFFDYDEIGIACNLGKLKKGIPYHKKPDEVHVVSGLYELLKGLATAGKKITILDEAGIHASSNQPMSKMTTAIKQLAYIIRHFNSSLLFITQTEGSIPPDLREKLVDWKIKVTKHNRCVEFGERQIGTDEYGTEYINFPKTKGYKKVAHSIYPYDSVFPTGFIMDMNLKEALSELSKLKSSIEVEKRGIEVIERLYDEGKGKETNADLIKKALKENPDWTDQEIADEVECSQQYVNKIKNAKKKLG